MNTLTKIALTFLVFILFITCREKSHQTGFEEKKSEISRHEVLKKPPSSYQDSLFIRSRSVIFFEPDSLQMEKIKSVNEKMIFESLTHDCFYQMQNARSLLERNWPGLQVMSATKTRWLIFRKNNGTDSVIDLNKINDICGIFLFDPQKNPIRTDMTNIKTQLGFYFKKQ